MKSIVLIAFFSIATITNIYAETEAHIVKRYKLKNTTGEESIEANVILAKINQSFNTERTFQNIIPAQQSFSLYFKKYCDCDQEIAKLEAKDFSTFIDQFKTSTSGYKFKVFFPHKDIEDEAKGKKIKVYDFDMEVKKIFDFNSMILTSKNKYGYPEPLINLKIGGIFNKPTETTVFKEINIKVKLDREPDILIVEVNFKTFGKLKEKTKKMQLIDISKSFIDSMKLLNSFSYVDITGPETQEN